jgi:hypothetical protein
VRELEEEEEGVGRGQQLTGSRPYYKCYKNYKTANG